MGGGLFWSLVLFLLWSIFLFSQMDTDFIEHIERINLMSKEGEAIIVQPTQRARTLEEYSISIIGKFLTSR